MLGVDGQRIWRGVSGEGQGMTMKVRDLLDEIKRCQKEYGKDFLEWDVYTEQITVRDKKIKKHGYTLNGKKHSGDWKTFKDGEGWEYFECVGYGTICPREKIFTVNVNY